MNVMALARRPEAEQIAALELGLPSHALADLAAKLELPKARLIEWLKLAPRTVTAREKKKERFSLAESERLLRVIRMHDLARNIFTTDEAVAEWLTAPDRSLAQKTPMEFLTTDVGSRKVENLLQAMMHGVPV